MVTDNKQIAVSFFDESGLGDNLHAGTLELPAELTVVEMLLRRVEFDCRTFAAGLDEPFRGLVQPLEVKEVDDEVVLSTPSSPDSTLLLDVAVRASNLEDSSLIARKLASNPLSLAASPSYLKRRGVPDHPAKLADHECLSFSRLGNRRFWKLTRQGRSISVEIDSTIVADQGDNLVELASLGCGIVMMPKWVMRDYLRDGKLKLILEDWRCPLLPLHIVYPRSKFLPEKTRQFSNYVYSKFRERNILPR